MEFPRQIKAIGMGLSILYFRYHRSAFPTYFVVLSLRIVFVYTSSVQHMMKCHIVCQNTRLGGSSIQRVKNKIGDCNEGIPNNFYQGLLIGQLMRLDSYSFIVLLRNPCFYLYIHLS